MIRRTFWLGAGAAAGILGYRRVTALGRRFTAPLARPGLQTALHRQQRGVLTATRGTFRFARDVREGMDLYMSRHSVPDDLPSENNSHDRKDGR
jgi:hypothetical protein